MVDIKYSKDSLNIDILREHKDELSFPECHKFVSLQKAKQNLRFLFDALSQQIHLVRVKIISLACTFVKK